MIRSQKAAFLQPGQPKLQYTPAAVATTATPTASATLAVAMTARSNATTEVSARIAQTTQMEGSGMANMAALAVGLVAHIFINIRETVMEQEGITTDEEEEALSHSHLQGHTPLMTGDRIPPSEDNSQLVHRRRKPAIETDAAAMRRATAHGDDGL